MNRTNLMPAVRLARLAQARSVRRWVKIVSVYSTLVIAACGAIGFTAATDAPQDAKAVHAYLERAKKKSAAIGADVAAEQTRMASVMEVSEQPDWSILLSVLSRTLGDDIVLTAVDTSGPDGAGGASTMPDVFTITGVGRSQPAIAQFVLRLERLGLFSRVDLVQTSPQSVFGTDGIGFKLECATAIARGGAK
jgi:hypothetical protein